MIIRLLLWIGFVAYDSRGNIAWPFHAPPRHMMLFYWRHHRKPYIFRNLPHVIKWVPGRLLPRRWGIGCCGFEFGDRGH